MFLTMPICWRETLAQYAGRLHGLHGSKRDVIIYDYVDENEPMLAKMAAKREAGDRSLGYRVLDRAELYPAPASREPALQHGGHEAWRIAGFVPAIETSTGTGAADSFRRCYFTPS
jgi:hypothetical protein